MNISRQLLDYKNPKQPTGWVAIVSILSIVYYLVSLSLLQVLNFPFDLLPQNQVNPAIDGTQSGATFLILGLGGMVITIGFYLAVPFQVRSVTGLALLAGWFVTIKLAGIFPLELIYFPHLSGGADHELAGKTLICIVVAAVFMALRLKFNYR